MWVTKKAIARLFHLHVSLVCMVTRDHGDDTYAHYATNLWPKDLNFIILSLSRCFCLLGETPMCNSKKLYDKLLVNDHFEKILCGKSR